MSSYSIFLLRLQQICRQKKDTLLRRKVNQKVWALVTATTHDSKASKMIENVLGYAQENA